MPLFSFVLHLLRAWSKDLAASVASGRKLVCVAFAAVDFVFLGAEGFVDERAAADSADEAPLVPVLLFVGEIL